MRRRQFITLLGAAAVWPRAARAQQPALPVIGWLGAGSPERDANPLAIYQRTLANAGYVVGRNVTIEYRHARGQYDRLSALASDLVRRQVSLIVTWANSDAARAAQAATATIPVLFAVGDDPAKLGLVASLNRPGGNLSGVNYFLTEVIGKRLAILRELLPAAAQHIGALVNPDAALARSTRQELTAAASALEVRIDLVPARNSDEIDAAFAAMARDKVGGLFVAPDTFLASRSVQIVTLATRHAIPAIYPVREYVEAGGLASYGPSRSEVATQLGVYSARILSGANPAELPVVQTTKLELVINRQTAKALALQIPDKLLAIADEVIE